MIAGGDKTRGLILFAHGARDPGWAEPFELLAAKVRDRAPGQSVRLAFLELMQPDLSHAAAELIGSGITAIRISPLKRRMSRPIDCAPPAGEDEGVLEALAAYCAYDLT